MDFHSAVDRCKSLGNGSLAHFESMEELQEVWQKAITVMDLEEEYMWSAYERRAESPDHFRDVQTDKEINHDLWNPGQPNNLYQRCVIFDRTGYDDEYCHNQLPFACQLEQRYRHRLRGLCSESILDKVYFPDTLLGKLIWVGAGSNENENTFISFNSTAFRWEAQKAGSSAVWAFAEADYESLLIGTYNWTVFNDQRCGSGRSSYSRQLSLTFCTDDEFNCDDGSCLLLDYWCDSNFAPEDTQMATRLMTCKDGSDEKMCHVIEPNPNYQPKVAPSREPPTKVDVFLSLIQILDISAMTGKIRLKFNLSLEWFDPRLNFHGNWQIGEYNVLSSEELASIWKPEFNYSNIQQADMEVHQSPEVFVYSVGNWSWKKTSLSSLYNYQVFSGRENKFHWTVKLR